MRADGHDSAIDYLIIQIIIAHKARTKVGQCLKGCHRFDAFSRHQVVHEQVWSVEANDISSESLGSETQPSHLSVKAI